MRDRKTWLANKQATVEDNGNDTKYDAYGFFVKKQNLFSLNFNNREHNWYSYKRSGERWSFLHGFVFFGQDWVTVSIPPTPMIASPTWKMCMYFLMISHATQKEQASSPHCEPVSEAHI